MAGAGRDPLILGHVFEGGLALQKGMYFRKPPSISILLMSQRPGAPYDDSLSQDGKLLAETSKEQGFPSKSEFVRYAIARALEERLSVKTIEDIFESRRQIRAGKTVPLERLIKEE